MNEPEVVRRALDGGGWDVWELTVPATSVDAEAQLLAEASDLVREVHAGCVVLSGIDWREEHDAYRLTVFIEARMRPANGRPSDG